MSERLSAVVANNKTGGLFLKGPGWREATGGVTAVMLIESLVLLTWY